MPWVIINIMSKWIKLFQIDFGSCFAFNTDFLLFLIIFTSHIARLLNPFIRILDQKAKLNAPHKSAGTDIFSYFAYISKLT